MNALTFHHSNGWTMSVNHNVGGQGYSVVAYPTADKALADVSTYYTSGKFEERAFKWGGDKTEGWCSSLFGLMKLAQEVMAAEPPDTHGVQPDPVAAKLVSEVAELLETHGDAFFDEDK
jgi:hypothetical protein